MRILYVLRELRDDGIGVYCERLARLLPADVDLLTTRVTATRVGSAFARIHERPDLFHVPTLTGWRRTAAFLAGERYDVVHLHELHLLSVIAPPARLRRAPVIGTSHAEAAGSAQWNQLKKKLFACGLSALLADRYVAISSDIEEEFRTLYRIPGRRVERILTGVDLGHFRPPSPAERAGARRELGLDPAGFVLVQLGRLADGKNVETTLRTTAALRRELDRPVTVLVAGEGPLDEELRAEAARLGLGSGARFLGHTDPRLVLWASDVLCLPSRAEGQPLVVSEALACGVVPFRSRTSGYRDQIGGIAGLHEMDPDDAELNAKRLAELAVDSHRRALSAACVQRAAERFDQADMARRWQALYRRVAGP